MKSVTANHAPSSLESQLAAITTRPSTWSIFDVAWSTPTMPEIVHITTFDLSPVMVPGRVHLAGCRYEMSEAIIEELGPRTGYFCEFFAVSEASGEMQVHRLLNSKSVMYSSTTEEDDSVYFKDIPKAQRPDRVPEWKSTEAQWPTYQGEPMIFIDQVTLPKNAITESLLTWNKVLFLFAIPTPQGPSFKVYSQVSREQTAAGHYRSETIRAMRTKRPKRS